LVHISDIECGKKWLNSRLNLKVELAEFADKLLVRGRESNIVSGFGSEVAIGHNEEECRRYLFWGVIIL
jgi:hypothetical protein